MGLDRVYIIRCGRLESFIEKRGYEMVFLELNKLSILGDA